MASHSCPGFDHQMDWVCDIHDHPMDCPDALVVYRPRLRGYGIPVRDGLNATASSTVQIKFCPWCGAELASATD